MVSDNGEPTHRKLSAEIRIPVKEVSRDPQQPRKYFGKKALDRLAHNIKAVGQKTPIVVRRSETGNGFLIVEGERRWRAHQIAGLEEIRAFVTDSSDPREIFLDQITADVHREGYTAFEIARAMFKMKDEMSMPVSKIAVHFGKSEPWVYQHLKLLKLCPEVAEMMEPDRKPEDRLKFQIALLITHFPHDLQKKIAKLIYGKRMTLKRARHIIETLANEAGHEVGGKTVRTAGSKWSRFSRFVIATSEEVSIWGEREDTIKEACSNRNLSEVKALADSLKQYNEDILSIQEILREHIESRRARLSARR